MKSGLESLAEIAATTNTDKLGHGYYDVYQGLFGHLREQPVTLMEHGILGGDSIEVWSRFFRHPETRIWGVDIHDRGYRSEDPRVQLRFGSNADTAFMRSVYAESGPLNWCIEDAAHFASHQIQSFIDGWPFIKPGGLWISEDQHVCHSPVHQDVHISFLEYCAKLATEMQDPRGAEGCAAYDPLHLRADIESIELRKGLAIIRKRA